MNEEVKMARMKAVGKHITEARKKQNFTQTQLGNMVGKTMSTIQKYENGIIEIPISVLEEISEALDDNWAILGAFTFDEFTEILMDDYEKRRAQLLDNYEKLNHEGQNEAIKRIIELTHLKQYTEIEIPCEND